MLQSALVQNEHIAQNLDMKADGAGGSPREMQGSDESFDVNQMGGAGNRKPRRKVSSSRGNTKLMSDLGPQIDDVVPELTSSASSAKAFYNEVLSMQRRAGQKLVMGRLSARSAGRMYFKQPRPGY